LFVAAGASEKIASIRKKGKGFLSMLHSSLQHGLWVKVKKLETDS
jgi:hypothetical protein